jgi:ACS family glucarate transporter-like MFS transporter
MNMVGQIGGVTASSLTPLIADTYGWTPSFLVAAGLCVLGALAWLFVNPNDRLETR